MSFNNFVDRTRNGSGFLLFGDHQMVIGTCGHLWQVGDSKDLAVHAQLPHQASDGLGNRAANPGVNFVEDQRLDLAQLAGRYGDGQCNPGQFSARRDLADRPWRRASVPCDEERNLIEPACRRLHAWGQCHFETSALHAQFLYQCRNRVGQSGRRVLAAL